MLERTERISFRISFYLRWSRTFTPAPTKKWQYSETQLSGGVQLLGRQCCVADPDPTLVAFYSIQIRT